MRIRTLLKKAGLSQKEADIYIEAISIGAQPASIIAEKAGINRVTTYVSLRKLVQKGLANTYYKAGVQYFVVDNPKKLIDYLRRQQQQIKKLETQMMDAIDTIHVPTIQDISPMQVQSFHGFEGTRAALEQVLDSERIVIISRMNSSTPSYRKYILEYFFDTFVERNIQGKAILEHHKELTSLEERIRSNGKELSIVNYIPFDIDIFIYNDDNVVFVSSEHDILSGAIIKSPSFAQSFLNFFQSNIHVNELLNA